ncbi:MAG: hypothetical protein ACI8SE_000969 [Bacteroidia bacterium]
MPTEDLALDTNLVLTIMIESDDNLLVAGASIGLSELTNLTKKFLRDTSSDNANSSTDPSQKTISLKNQRGTTVTRYVNIYNELIRA